MKEKLILLSPCFAFSMCCRIMLQHIVSCFEDIPDKDRVGVVFAIVIIWLVSEITWQVAL